MIKLIKSTFYKEKRIKRELIKFIKSAKQLSFGEECEKFERNLAQWQGRKFCIVVNSGSSANLALIQALLNLGKIKKGDDLGFSALTWSTNVMPLIQLGLKPTPIDIELDTLNVSSKKLIETLKRYPLKALFLTNLLGFCSDIDRVQDICIREKIILLEDNCESLGTIYKGRKLGNFGIASTVSFYVGHHLSLIEGGAIFTDDENIAMMVKLVRAHGWDRNVIKEKQEEFRKKFKVNAFHAPYTFYDLGYNLRPTEIQGFLGNAQLRYLDEINKERSKNFMKLANAIYARKDHYYPMKFNHIDFLSNFALPIIGKTKGILNALVKKCEGKIEIRPIVGGDMTKQPFFRKYLPHFALLLKASNATLAHEQGLYIGNNPEFTQKELTTIIHVFTQA